MKTRSFERIVHFASCMPTYMIPHGSYTLDRELAPLHMFDSAGIFTVKMTVSLGYFCCNMFYVEHWGRVEIDGEHLGFTISFC
jgi:hypothetical protein